MEYHISEKINSTGLQCKEAAKNIRNSKMAPNLLGTSALFLAETTTTSDPVQQVIQRTPHHQQNSNLKQISKGDQPKYHWDIVWRNVIAFIYLHTAALYGMYLFFFVCTWKTFFWTYFVALLASQGVTAGAHRLWAHRAYKAKLPMRIFLMLCQTMAFQNHIYEWVRDHRVHHKFTDTDADPHNAKRGFFFSHMGWLLVRKQKDVMIKGKTVDMSDLDADPVVAWQKKYYLAIVPILCFMIPAFIPWYYWGEDEWVSWYVAAILRYTYSLNCTWLVNSAAHMWGNRPYDKSIGPTENLKVALSTMGEGWHNYHHVFPWDYKAAELGNYRGNPTTAIIDGFAKIGWAYDLKTVSTEMIRKRALRTGDGSKTFGNDENDNIDAHDDHHHKDAVWGWGDLDMKVEDIQDAKIFNNLRDP